jgi:sigma-B regulation protein RsbU (phosphoserine phosphatase)
MSTNPIKRIFELYTSDLSYQEIERLIKREANEVYEFFKSDIPKPDQSKNKIIRALIFARSLFNAFIMKLTPARRIFYLIALLFFMVGYFQQMHGYIFLAFIIVSLLLAFELADKLSAKSELDVARKIQFDLIPKIPSKIYNYELSAYYEPAREVGGDYYDVVETPDRTFIIVGDISGKGMAAALYMVRVQAIIYQLLNNYSSIVDLIINLKKYFSKNLRREYFLTLAIASIEKDGVINIARAGHPPIFHYRSEPKDFYVVNPQGIGIGLNDRGVFEKTLEQISIIAKKNDIVFMYTDGVTETMNVNFQQFGYENVKRIIQLNADKTSEEIKNALLRGIITFRGSAIQNDDISMVILKAT